MKPLAFALLVLVGSLVLTNLPTPSYADPKLDTLLGIATKARDNISIQLSQLTSVPDDINQLYNHGSEETDALTQSISQGDQDSAKTHFLSAMRIFKTINDKISSLTPAATSDQPSQIDTSRLNDQINRMQNLGDKLSTIATNNNVDIDFTKFNALMQNAKQNLDAGNLDQVNNQLETANQFLLSAHHTLADAATKKTSDRAKDFTEKQIERLSQTQEPSPQQNVTQPNSPPVTPTQETNATETVNINDMITKLRQLVSEGKTDEALKLIKMIEASQNQKTSSHVHTTETPNATQQDDGNNTNASATVNSPDNFSDKQKQTNSSGIENQTSSSDKQKQGNGTQSNAGNAVNATKKVKVVNDNQPSNEKKNSHDKKSDTGSQNKDRKKNKTGISND